MASQRTENTDTGAILRATSETEMTATLEQHRANYASCKGRIAPLKDSLKAIQKEMRASVQFLKAYMRENELDVLDLGNGEEMRSRTKQAVTFNEDNLLDFFADPSAIERYKQEYMQEKTSISVKRKRTEAGAAS